VHRTYTRDVARSPEPSDGPEREILTGWLAFHRDALAAKCDGVPPAELARTGLGGSALSLLGLVRHLTEMERVYIVYALGGGPLEFVYGPYEDGQPAGDFDLLRGDMVQASMEAWHAERTAADEILASCTSLDEPGRGNRRSMRWNLVKVTQEYARHNGHADLLREAIDGATGE
jgi:Protein of unknown function (DUF664)